MRRALVASHLGTDGGGLIVRPSPCVLDARYINNLERCLAPAPTTDDNTTMRRHATAPTHDVHNVTHTYLVLTS